MAGPWSLDALAAVSGESADRLRRYLRVGLLHEQADGDLEPGSLHRVRLIQFARARGVNDDRLAAVAADQGDVLSVFDELDPGDDPCADLAVAAQELGLDAKTTAELADILGWDNLTGTESDVSALRVFAQALEMGMPPDALKQIVRVLADHTDRLADAEVRTFHDYVHERFRSQGLVGPQLRDATRSIGKPVLALAEPALLYFHRRAYRRAYREDMLRHLAEDITPAATAPGEEYASVLFVDLASFTPLTATMGDHVAANVLGRFGATVRASAGRHNGRIVKQIGDAFMLTFDQPVDAIEFGLDMDRFVDEEPHFPALHIGAHHGRVLYREGDYLGGTVNLAARVASAGAAGQFLITQELHDAAGDVTEAELVPMPPRQLKGIRDPLSLIEVRRRGPKRAGRQTDPVCGLLLHPEDVAVTTTWRGASFAFCCELCKDTFTHHPAQFATTAHDLRSD